MVATQASQKYGRFEDHHATVERFPHNCAIRPLAGHHEPLTRYAAMVRAAGRLVARPEDQLPFAATQEPQQADAPAHLRGLLATVLERNR